MYCQTNCYAMLQSKWFIITRLAIRRNAITRISLTLGGTVSSKRCARKIYFSDLFVFVFGFCRMDTTSNYRKECLRLTTDILHASTPQINRKHTKCWTIRTKPENSKPEHHLNQLKPQEKFVFVHK